MAIAALAALLIARGDADEAVALLGRIPETAETRRLLAEARLAAQRSTWPPATTWRRCSTGCSSG